MIETNDFKIAIDNIINEIQKTQLKMFQDANANVLELYFHIGKIIDERISWGNKFVDELSIGLTTNINIGFLVKKIRSFLSLVEQVPGKA